MAHLEELTPETNADLMHHSLADKDSNTDKLAIRKGSSETGFCLA